jgi:hypothetical protein
VFAECQRSERHSRMISLFVILPVAYPDHVAMPFAYPVRVEWFDLSRVYRESLRLVSVALEVVHQG